MSDDPWDLLLALPDLRQRTFKTPGAGNTARPFKVRALTEDGLEVTTSKGGWVPLRAEAFAGALKALTDLGELDPEGWVPVSDETLVAVVQSENRDKAATSYVLPLLEAVGLVELARTRPARARLARPAAGA